MNVKHLQTLQQVTDFLHSSGALEWEWGTPPEVEFWGHPLKGCPSRAKSFPEHVIVVTLWPFGSDTGQIKSWDVLKIGFVAS